MAWLVVKYNQDWIPPHEENVYYVEKGDIIKFGRVRFKIRELKINRSQEGEYSEDAITHNVNILETSNNTGRRESASPERPIANSAAMIRGGSSAGYEIDDFRSQRTLAS